MAGALNPRRPPKIRTRFRPPILMARPVSPFILGRMSRGNVAFAGNFGSHRRRHLTGLLPAALMP